MSNGNKKLIGRLWIKIIGIIVLVIVVVIAKLIGGVMGRAAAERELEHQHHASPSPKQITTNPSPIAQPVVDDPVEEAIMAVLKKPANPGSLTKKGTGTMFVVSTTGQAVTNQHVVAGCGELRMESRNGLAKLVTADSVNDLALLQIPGEAKDSASISIEPGKLRQGEDIVVFGFPLNTVLSSGGNLTLGVISALTGLGNNTNQIQITAPIQPGSSGSPVLNKKGEVVGVVSSKLSDSGMANATGQVGQNVNFAVNGQTLKMFLDINKVHYLSGAGFFSMEKSTADLADEARNWTLVIECWR